MMLMLTPGWVSNGRPAPAFLEEDDHLVPRYCRWSVPTIRRELLVV